MAWFYFDANCPWLIERAVNATNNSEEVKYKLISLASSGLIDEIVALILTAQCIMSSLMIIGVSRTRTNNFNRWELTQFHSAL
jgi:hypothetical protein